MSEKKKKPPVLQLQPTLPPPSAESPDGGNNFVALETKQNSFPTQTKEGDFSLSEGQRTNMATFLEERYTVVAHGEFKEDQFERMEELGFGNGGVVLKVRYKPTNIIMARKIIMLDIKPVIRNQIMRELKVLQECNSPYIVGSYGNFCLNNEISICMEHMDGGSLDLIMKGGRIPTQVIPNITHAILEGLEYLHRAHNIIHRDVKPSNVLANTRGEIKLCDLGVSGHLINSMANSFVGTRSYMAPERLQGETYSIRSDLWSLGVSLVEMALGRYPIPQPGVKELADEMKCSPAGVKPYRTVGNQYASHLNPMHMPIFELLQIITTCDPPTLPKELFPEDLRKFVESCLKKSPSERSTLRESRDSQYLEKTRLMSSADFANWVKCSIEALSVLND